MPMIPPLVRDPSPDDRQSSTGRPVAARMVRTQRQYASNFNISFVYEPPKPIFQPGTSTPPDSTFDKWRAAAALDPHGGGGAGDLSNPAAHGDAAASGVVVAPRRRLHDALLGSTALVLLGVLGGIGYLVWSGAVPGGVAPGGTAPKGSSLAAMVQPLVDFAAKAAARPVPDHAPSPAPNEAATADVPAPPPVPQPAAAAPFPDASVVVGEAAPVPERAAGLAALAKPSEADASAPTPAMPAAPAEAVSLPVSEQATATVPPAKVPDPDATAPASAVPARPVPTVEQAAAKAVPPVKPFEPERAAPVPATASMTVRLPPAPEWTTVPPAALAGVPEAAPLPAPPVVPAVPELSSGPAAVSAEAERTAPPGVDAQQVVSTMTLVQQMSLLVHDMHDEGLRYRTEVTALTGAVQAKASSLEERLKLAEARSAAGSDAGGLPAGLPASDAAPVLRGYRVQAGSPGAAVLTDVGAGTERAARLLVMVGDQLPGAGRVTAIVQRGRAWIVRTERGVIQ